MVRELGGAEYLARVDGAVSDSVSEFVARLRERLVAIASDTE